MRPQDPLEKFLAACQHWWPWRDTGACTILPLNSSWPSFSKMGVP
jgi:hypothetical protein